MQYLHTMVRVTDIDQSLDFYCTKLGLKEVRRYENEKGRFTLIFLAAPDDEGRFSEDQAPALELTYNWDPEEYAGGRNFGHLAYAVPNIYDLCQHLMDNGVTINPAAARWPHGVCPVPRRHLHRTAAKRRRPAVRRTLGLHGEHGSLVACRLPILPIGIVSFCETDAPEANFAGAPPVKIARVPFLIRPIARPTKKPR